MTIDAAHDYASRLFDLELRGSSDTDGALFRIEQKYGISPNQLMHLRSRRAKQCDVGLFARLRGAYPSLSQRGFNHIPHNPMQRVPEEGGGKKPGRVLDAFNDRQEERTLHPTNGWRKLSVKRSRAQMLVAAIRNGQRMDTASMANFLRFG